MTTLNEIEQRLSEIDQGTFQKLASAYLREEGRAYLNPVGQVVGANKTRIGTPDAFVARPDGKYDFAEYTTQRIKLGDKLARDLASCLDNKKTGIPDEKLGCFVFCHTGHLDIGELEAARGSAIGRFDEVSEIGLESLAHGLRFHHPGLAKEFLNVSPDTEQITTIDRFVSEYDDTRTAIPLAIDFGFRHDDLEAIIALMQGGTHVFLTGGAGVGKTRLAIEAARRLASLRPQSVVYCIRPRTLDLYDDLSHYCAQPGEYVLVVDDANRVNSFEYIANLLESRRPDRHIVVIVTVREYAQRGIVDRRIAGSEAKVIRVKPLSRNDICDLVERAYGIKNSLFLDRIAAIAQGNPRLAMMAGALAKREGRLDSIYSSADLYEEYFSAVRADLAELGERNVVACAAMVVLFRRIDSEDKALVAAACDMLGVSTEDFWSVVSRLHDLELVDQYVEPLAVRVQDQVLATYLFYRAVFKDRSLSLEGLLRSFFEIAPASFAEALSAAFEAVGSPPIYEHTKDVALLLWDDHEFLHTEELRRTFLRMFWPVLQTQALGYVKSSIEAVQSTRSPVTMASFQDEVRYGMDYSLELLELLGGSSLENAEIATDLTLTYFRRRPDHASHVGKVFKDGFGLAPHSHLEGYSRQKRVLDQVWEACESGRNEAFSCLLLSLARKYLSVDCDTATSSRGGVVTITRFRPLLNQDLSRLRQDTFKRLMILHVGGSYGEEPLQVIESAIEYQDDAEFLRSDLAELLPDVTQTLAGGTLREQLAADRICSAMRRNKIEGREDLESHLDNELLSLYRLVTSRDVDHAASRRRPSGDVRSDLMKNYGGRDQEGYLSVLGSFLAVRAVLRDHETWHFDDVVSELFEVLSQEPADVFTAVLSGYLAAGDPLEVRAIDRIVARLVGAIGSSACWDIVSATEYPTKNRWKLATCLCAPVVDIDGVWLGRLMDLYQNAPVYDLLVDPERLEPYVELSKDIIVRITHILIDREDGATRALWPLFNGRIRKGHQLLVLFESDPVLLERAYFLALESGLQVDHDGSALADVVSTRREALAAFIDWQLASANQNRLHKVRSDQDMSLVWHLLDAQWLTEITRRIFEFDATKSFHRASVLESLFRSVSLNTQTVQDDLLKKVIAANASDKGFIAFLFRLVSSFPRARRLQFIEALINSNADIDVFKGIDLEPRVSSWSGSHVPVLNGEIDYLRSILLMMSGVALLPHRDYLERRISALRQEVNRAERREFLDGL